MAPGKPARVIKLRVPRHNAQRIGTKLGAEIKNLARSQRIRTEIYQPSQEVAQAVESASEWNSLLITARAERGPQWDVGTQQFHVDKHSDMHYDATLLFDAVKKRTEEEQADEEQQVVQQHPQRMAPQQIHQSHSRHHTPRSERDYHMSNAHQQVGPPGHDPSMPHRHHPPAVNYPYPTTPNMNMNARGPPMPNRQYAGAPRGAPFNTAVPSQFYSGEGPSPMRMQGMGMMDHGSGHPMSGVGPGMGMGWDMRRMEEFPMQM